MKLRTPVTSTIQHMKIIAWSIDLDIRHLDNFYLCKEIYKSLLN